MTNEHEDLGDPIRGMHNPDGKFVIRFNMSIHVFLHATDREEHADILEDALRLTTLDEAMEVVDWAKSEWPNHDFMIIDCGD